MSCTGVNFDIMEHYLLGIFDTYQLEYNGGGIFLFFTAVVSIAVVVFVLFQIKPDIRKILPVRRIREKITLDLNNSKKTAYQITFLIHRYETPYNKELLKKLEKYKYRKDVDSLDEDTVQLIGKFIEYVRSNYGRV